MLNLSTIPADETTIVSFQSLTPLQLGLVADSIVERLCQYRPEFSNLVRLHRACGCRVQELFEPERWLLISNSKLQVTPQKRNAVRLLQLADIGFADAAAFQYTYNDMGRLPKRQYERAFSYCIAEEGLWRLYDNGYAHPSTHFLRHVKIKELAAQGLPLESVATWIGEKRVENLDYYLESLYFM